MHRKSDPEIPLNGAVPAASEAARRGGREFLAAALADSRARTLALLDAYSAALGDSLLIPYCEQFNPPRWEAGHIAWFQDYWIARNQQRSRGIDCDPDHARPAGRLPRADTLYNSSTVEHRSRWHLDLPDLAETRAYLSESLAETLAVLASTPETDAELYFFRLVLFHEDMHGEAGAYMAQALDIALPASLRKATKPVDEMHPLHVPGSHHMLGWGGDGFAFDNELAPHEVTVAAFEIDVDVVSWRRYLPFVEDTGATPPRYLRQHDGRWQRRMFGQWETLPFDAPATHLRRDEADAWCRWTGRRLPDRSGMGSRRADAAEVPLGPGMGMDRQPLRALPRLRAPPVSRLFRALVRRPLCHARRQPRNVAAHGASAVPQLLHPRTRRRVWRISKLRELTRGAG